MILTSLGSVGGFIYLLYFFIFPPPKQTPRVCKHQKKRRRNPPAASSKNEHFTREPLIEHNRGLDSSLVPHSLQTLPPLLELIRLIYNALDLDLAAVEVVDGGREHVRLGEGADDGDFVAEDLARRP